MDDTLRTMLSEGCSHREIAAVLGVTRDACIGRAHRLGIVGLIPSGWAARPILLDHVAIIAAKAEGKSCREVAEIFGCSAQHVSQVARGIAPQPRGRRAVA